MGSCEWVNIMGLESQPVSARITKVIVTIFSKMRDKSVNVS